jgi:hypothetical protein
VATLVRLAGEMEWVGDQVKPKTTPAAKAATATRAAKPAKATPSAAQAAEGAPPAKSSERHSG